MNQKEIVNNQYRYIQWGYESYKDNKTGEIREDYIDRLNEQERENAILKKALELACGDSDNYWYEKKALKRKISLYDYFIEQAKESLK